MRTPLCLVRAVLSLPKGASCALSLRGRGVHRPESPTQKAISVFLLLRGEALQTCVKEEVISLSSWRRNSGVIGATHPF